MSDKKLHELKISLERRLAAMFTATADPRDRHVVRSILRDVEALRAAPAEPCPRCAHSKGDAPC